MLFLRTSLLYPILAYLEQASISMKLEAVIGTLQGLIGVMAARAVGLVPESVLNVGVDRVLVVSLGGRDHERDSGGHWTGAASVTGSSLVAHRDTGEHQGHSRNSLSSRPGVGR